MILAIEGLDGAGKGTQISLLKKLLDCKIFRYPTKKSPKLRAYLNKRIELDPKEVFNLFLNDIIAEQEELKKAKKEHKLVILDRYVFSTIAYKLKGISFEGAKGRVFDKTPVKPDIVFFLDIPAKNAAHRKKKQKSSPDRYEKDVAYLDEVRKNFLKLSNEKFLCKKWVVIDAQKPVREIQKLILSYL